MLEPHLAAKPGRNASLTPSFFPRAARDGSPHPQVVTTAVGAYQAATKTADCALRVLPRALALLAAAGPTLTITGTIEFRTVQDIGFA